MGEVIDLPIRPRTEQALLDPHDVLLDVDERYRANIVRQLDALLATGSGVYVRAARHDRAFVTVYELPTDDEPWARVREERWIVGEESAA